MRIETNVMVCVRMHGHTLTQTERLKSAVCTNLLGVILSIVFPPCTRMFGLDGDSMAVCV